MARLDRARQFLQLSADLTEGGTDDGAHFQRRLQLDGVRVAVIMVALVTGQAEAGRLPAAGVMHDQRRRQRHERHDRQGRPQVSGRRHVQLFGGVVAVRRLNPVPVMAFTSLINERHVPTPWTDNGPAFHQVDGHS